MTRAQLIFKSGFISQNSLFIHAGSTGFDSFLLGKRDLCCSRLSSPMLGEQPCILSPKPLL